MKRKRLIFKRKWLFTPVICKNKQVAGLCSSWSQSPKVISEQHKCKHSPIPKQYFFFLGSCDQWLCNPSKRQSCLLRSPFGDSISKYCTALIQGNKNILIFQTTKMSSQLNKCQDGNNNNNNNSVINQNCDDYLLGDMYMYMISMKLRTTQHDTTEQAKARYDNKIYEK